MEDLIIDAFDGEGMTPLSLGIQEHGDNGIAITRLLLENNANPNLANPYTGYTPLHYAVMKNASKTKDLLLQYGANPKVIICTILEEKN